ncbi:mitogen-activated protein kinase kinase kinase 18-like [Chenopodium quinoa]|uniref:mitogen-activated protein kinase kinase kinase 18-like n=1 Tax=Chenopodium quinoa TaxID=63459 RepID=UPI000B7875DC|nr:mitogen-activated protein kinase kinase kinase 18-like [Chenopodium quinoa]
MKWSRGKAIGHGSSAVVSLGKCLPSGELLAVKSMAYSRSNALRKEQEIHSRLRCDRIIEYKGYDVTHENGKVLYNILLEYASCGTLVDAIQKKGGSLSDPLVRRYTSEILRGLEYLHFKGIVHCDIKGANILVTNDGVKIGDFGCCKQVDDMAGFNSSVTEISGTPMYMAPEVARGEQQSYQSDVWALGCTVFEMATGLSPWPNISQDPLSALYHIGFSGAMPEIKIPGLLSDQATDFLSKCLKRDPKERWSVAELLKHPFIIDVGPDHGPISDTPTSILDQGIWEISYSAQKNEAQVGSTKSPIERIKELVENSDWEEFPNWASDEDWITVRCNKTTENVTSGLGLSFAQNVKPNWSSRNLIFTVGLLCSSVEQNLPFVSFDMLNCCRDTICSMYTYCINCDFTCNYIILCHLNNKKKKIQAIFCQS